MQFSVYNTSTRVCECDREDAESGLQAKSLELRRGAKIPVAFQPETYFEAAVKRIVTVEH